MIRIDVTCHSGFVWDIDMQQAIMTNTQGWTGSGTLHISVRPRRYYEPVDKVEGIEWRPLHVAYTEKGHKFETPKRIKTWNE